MTRLPLFDQLHLISPRSYECCAPRKTFAHRSPAQYGLTWRVRRGEVGDFGAAWLRCHGLSVGPESLGLLCGVRSAASSLPMQPQAPVVARYGPGKRPL